MRNQHVAGRIMKWPELVKRQNIKKGFNGMAHYYDLLAAVVSGNRINKSQIQFIPDLPVFKHCLIIGGGSGFFLEHLLLRTETGQIDYVDISDVMIAKARRRIQKNLPDKIARVNFYCGSFESIPNGKPFDLVAANYFLDLFSETELRLILKNLHTLTSMKAILYITDFNKATGNILKRKLSSWFMQLLYWYFRRMTLITGKELPAFDRLVTAAGFCATQSAFFLGGMMYTCLYKKT